DFTPLVAAFTTRQDGPDKLAAAFAGASLAPDSAKLALRALYTLGRSDPSLVNVLSRAAGLDAEVKPLEKAEMEQLIVEVGSSGNPERGEAIFRRADLSCARCHALLSAGGGIGPDLSPIGQSSPVDYIANSLLLPDQAIKEEFHTL